MTAVLFAQGPTAGKRGKSLDPRLPGSTVLVFSISFSPLIPGIREMKVSDLQKKKEKKKVSDLLLDRPGLTSYL